MNIYLIANNHTKDSKWIKEINDKYKPDLENDYIVRFNNGKLMITYLPPYNEDRYYLLPDINYNAYNNVSKWIKMTRKNKIELFKNMVEEISSL